MKKKLYLVMVLLAFFGFPVSGDTGEQEEIAFLLFLPNSSNEFIDEELAMLYLDKLAWYLLDMNLTPGQIHVHGYAATAKNNIEPMDLSMNRALFLLEELQERGVPAALFSDAVAHGEVDTWGNNLTEEGRNLNRRVRILLDTYSPPPATITIIADADADINHETVVQAMHEMPVDESRTRIPWWIILLLLVIGLLLIAALIFCLINRKNRSDDETVDEQTGDYEPITAAGREASIVDAAPLAAAAIPLAINISANEDWKKTSFINRSNFMDLEKTVREIISGIPMEAFFDVHTIIEKLLQEHDEVYLVSVGNYTSAAHYHSRISSIIRDTDIVETVGNSYSKNIHDKFSECHLFRRKKAA